jgi:Xaa-Pro aminopeptidase
VTRAPDPGSVASEPLAPLDVSGRLDRLRALFGSAAEDGRPIDALVVTTPANIRWLSGFSGSAGLLLVTGADAVLTTDGRYRTQSREQLDAAGVGDEISVHIGGVQSQRDELVARSARAGALGLEADTVTWTGLRTWEELVDSALVATRGLVEGLRLVKDAGEVVRMERAASIADRALEAVLPLLAEAGTGAGEELTESRFAAAVDHAMRRLGAAESAFETIVASGENSAKPHARPGDRPIRSGDPVVVDFGAVFDGYLSDMTRTFCVGGEPTGELATVFEVVATSQRAGVEAVVPGVTAGSVDLACREVIAESGWAERFEHGTGHGVGLDIHEAPTVSQLGTAILAPGFVVTEDGARALTRFTKDIHGSLDQ